MALTKVSTDGVKDDAITKTKIPANQIEASELADNAVDTNAIADQAVALSKLPHGTSSNNGKFLRANNGADPTFETVNTDLVSDTSPQLGGTLQTNGNNIDFADTEKARFGNAADLQIYHDGTENRVASASGINHRITTDQLIVNNAANNEEMFKAIADGACELYHNAAKKLETNTNGIEVHGKLVLGNNDIPSGQISNYSLDVQGDGTNAYIDMGNVFPTYSAGQFPTARFKTVEANKTLEIQSMWGGDNVLYKHIELAADKTKFFIGTSNNVEIAHFGTFGLTFNGDTAAANALDDYEEGTFTATCENSVTLHSSQDLCMYTKIGRQVTIRGQVRVNNDNGGNQDFIINNAPFINVSGTDGSGSCVGAVRLWDQNVPSDTLNVVVEMFGASYHINFWVNRDNTGAERMKANANAYALFTITYFTS